MLRYLNYLRLYLRKRWSRKAEILAAWDRNIETAEDIAKYQRRRLAPNYFSPPKARAYVSNGFGGGCHYAVDPLVTEDQKDFLKTYEAKKQEPKL